MTDKIPQTKSDLKRQLFDQLQFLEDSANHYDQGRENEAKRMAVALRILLYDPERGNSKSLLEQLGLKNIKFLDTAIENTSNVQTAHCALVHILFAGRKTQYVALLDDTPGKMTDYDSWWNGVIFEDNEGNKISRRDIILTMADQDGGAHVDPCIRKDYSRLSKGQLLGHMYLDISNDNGWVNMQGAELASVRQIAHEVLKTLIPNYVKKPALPNGIAIRSSIRLEFEEKQNDMDKKSKEPSDKVGRNDPCPCGSGKKFKKCCGA